MTSSVNWPARPVLSIHARLTIWYGAILAITLAVFGLFVYVTLQRSMERETDRVLQQRAQDVNGAVVALRIPLRGQSIVIPNADAFAQADTFVQIVDFDGTVLSASDNLGDQVLPFDLQTLHMAKDRRSYWETSTVASEHLRLYNAPLFFAGQSVGLLQVGRNMQTVDAALAQLRLLMLSGLLASVVISGLIGSALARAALRPIDRLTQTADAIGKAQDFERRVEHRGPADEVGRLATTFNQMLGRLREAYAKVEAALAAQRRFVADASHELRTPLTTIRGNAALLRRVPDMTDTDREEALQQISSEADRMSRLVTDLLTLARADAGQHLERRPVAVRPIVQDVCRQIRLLADGWMIEAEDVQESHVLGDGDHLKQLLLILVDNAIKYTPQGGRVSLSVRKAGGWVEARVADTGIGISDDDLPHIFERFYRADHARSSAGTGLGLAIAKWITEEHGGQLNVESRRGRGSVFVIRLPSLPAPEPAKAVK